MDSFISRIDEISLDSRPIGNPAYALQTDPNGWSALINLDSNYSLALNSTGLLIWKAVNGRRTVEQIIDHVKDHFTDVPASFAEDVLGILEDLLNAGMIGFEVTADQSTSCLKTTNLPG